MPLNRPTQDELLESVAEYLAQDVEDPKADRFYRRVALNVVKLIRREQATGRSFQQLEHAQLGQLLGNNQITAEQLNSQLNDAIASKEFAINVDLTQTLLYIAQHKLDIDNPRYK